MHCFLIASDCDLQCNVGELIVSVVLKTYMVRIFILLLFAGTASAAGDVSDNVRISSDVLGYDLQYRVYLPDSVNAQAKLPVMFVTDGPSYLSRGRMPLVLDRLIQEGEIDPIVVVFVDSRDPDNLQKNRRNAQFLCNSDYLNFYADELIPTIESNYPVADNREARGVIGMSFGATNAACFGLKGSNVFSRLGMLSPANHPVSDLLPAYEESPLLPLKIFLSTGKPNDNTEANRRFHKVLKDKGYNPEYVEVREGHNWDNWEPLLDDLLLFLYAQN
jgi:enterochelin esterase-like enzyme